MSQNNSSVDTAKNSSSSTKKVYVMPTTVKAKIDANNALKQSIFTATKICKHCKSDEVKAIIEKFLKTRKEKHGVEFNINKIDTRLFKKHASERDLKGKDINGKSLFSFWLVLTLIDREIKAIAADRKAKEPVPLKGSQTSAKAA